METRVTGKIHVGEEKSFGLAFFDDSYLEMQLRFKQIEAYVTSLERTIVKELGIDLATYIMWKQL